MTGKGYVSLSLDKSQGKDIYKIFKTAGLDSIKASDFHITLMYDESNPEIEVLKNTKIYSAKISGVERLGKKGSKWEAIALTLTSPEIEKRHKELKNAGFKHSYPEYKCHMSIIYKPASTDEDIINLIHKLNVLPKVLKFGDEKHEKIKK